MPSWWKPVWGLVVHVLIGSTLFALIFSPAIALDLLIKWLKEELSISDFLSSLLTWTKVIVAALDAGLYVIFMVRMGWVFVTELWSIPAREHT